MVYNPSTCLLICAVRRPFGHALVVRINFCVVIDGAPDFPVALALLACYRMQSIMDLYKELGVGYHGSQNIRSL